MGLFSTIASAVSETVTTASSSSLSLPTVVQLHTNQTAPFRLDPTAQMPGYAVLTYQAAQVSFSLEDESCAPETVGLRSKKAVATVPDLGVWNCCVTGRQMQSGSINKTEPLVDSLLKIPSHEQKQKELDTFCFTVDLADLQKVEPAISLLQAALVRYLIDRPSITTTTVDIPPPSATRTTSLYQLRSVQFGLAPQDESASASATTTTTTAAPDEGDRQVSIALMIAAVLPTKHAATTANSQADNSSSDYHDKQAQALVVYHLRRYAAALNASLCFVKDKGYHRYMHVQSPTAATATTTTTAAADDDDGQNDTAADDIQDQGHQPTLSIKEMASVWSELAQGKAVWSTETSGSSSSEQNTAQEASVSPEGDQVKVDDGKETTHPKIYGPDHHNEDLIESVLLRNASYPGHWDAAKDSIWKVLPSQDSAGSANHSAAAAGKAGKGDEHWLSELRESVAVAEPLKTPPPKKSTKDAASAQKTPNEAAVTNFFESLLS
jgi:hypothetical protein